MNPLLSKSMELPSIYKAKSNVKNLYPNQAAKTDFVAQIQIPWYKKEYKYSPWLLKCDGKIVKYNMRGLHVWKALVSASHTIVAEWDTWNHLCYLTVICFAATGFCLGTGIYKSIDMDVSVVGRIQLLVSFVFAGYVGIVINRWDRLRNVTLGTVWGSTENLNVIMCSILHPLRVGASKERLAEIDSYLDRFLRYSRLCFTLIFMALQSRDDMSHLLEAGGPSLTATGGGAGPYALLTPKEHEWLKAVNVGTRPLHVNMWLLRMFETLETGPMRVKRNGVQESQALQNITSLRGGIGATLALVNTQLPYAYVHLIYWVIQVLLVVLAIETGVNLATNMYTMQNGNGNYTPEHGSWPKSKIAWYMNSFTMYTWSNVIFCLFCEGLLKLCDKLSNPCSVEDSSLSERTYDSFLFNNVMAMRASFSSYDDLFEDEVPPRAVTPPATTAPPHVQSAATDNQDPESKN